MPQLLRESQTSELARKSKASFLLGIWGRLPWSEVTPDLDKALSWLIIILRNTQAEPGNNFIVIVWRRRTLRTGQEAEHVAWFR